MLLLYIVIITRYSNKNKWFSQKNYTKVYNYFCVFYTKTSTTSTTTSATTSTTTSETTSAIQYFSYILFESRRGEGTRYSGTRYSMRADKIDTRYSRYKI